MEQYHNLLKDILENGEQRQDRTNTGTLSVFGRQLRFNLKDGFPAITTKKLAWKAVVSELLWFIEGSNDERRLAEILYGTRDPAKKTIWTGNAQADYWVPKAKFDGDLGRVYGVNWKSWEGTRLVNIKVLNDEKFKTDFDRTINPDFTSNVSGIVGKQFSSNNHGDYVVIREYYQGKHLRYDCKFIITGYVATGVTKQNILKTNQVRDLYYPSRYGVGAIGNKDAIDPKLIKLLEPTWDGMLSRCYNKKSSDYNNYGAKGVHVDSRWKIFEYFAADFTKIHNWQLKLDYPKEYTLDKDICGTNRYSSTTTRWASKKEQVHNSGFRQYYIDPETNETKLVSKTFTDQIKTLIAGIKQDPTGRRHIISAWNVAELDQMALPPCHVMAQFYVHSNQTLSCHMYQRSADVFLGVPFNIASYALLTHMIAQICGLGVNELVISMGDSHIYKNHIEQVKEQLTRQEFPLPLLWLNPKIKNIDDFTMKDITLFDYQSHGTIKAEMAV
jgi:thymidylate synthase